MKTFLFSFIDVYGGFLSIFRMLRERCYSMAETCDTALTLFIYECYASGAMWRKKPLTQSPSVGVAAARGVCTSDTP